MSLHSIRSRAPYSFTGLESGRDRRQNPYVLSYRGFMGMGSEVDDPPHLPTLTERIARDSNVLQGSCLRNGYSNSLKRCKGNAS